MARQRLSNDATYKVRAALVAAGRGGLLQTAAHVDACLRWYEALPLADRTIADMTADAFVSGDLERAHLLANLLPLAPLPAGQSRTALLQAERKKTARRQ